MTAPTTYAGIGKLVATLSEEHGGVRVDREEEDGQTVIIVRARSQEPVRCVVSQKGAA
ncbi:MAG TPA: hypothetical protein VGN75_03550 [Kaistia sp.]|nr:hypothetical protein [Kaistia sp.]